MYDQNGSESKMLGSLTVDLEEKTKMVLRVTDFVGIFSELKDYFHTYLTDFC